MSDVIVRGNVLKVTASPLDYAGNPVAPSSVELFLTYMDPATGAETTHGPIAMTSTNSAGTTWTGSFDTSLAMEGPLFGSVRAINPSGAADFKQRLVANPANPDPT